MNWKKPLSTALALLGLVTFAGAQIPDLLNALDAGGRAMGIGGATYGTDANTFSINANPAGLGFITQAMYGVAYRNMPESRSRVSGNFDDPTFDTNLRQGSFGLSHVGYAFPMAGGTIGISYTRSGSIRDERSGDGLTQGALTVRNYTEVFRAQTDLFTVAYGKSSGGGGANYGIGVVVANQYILDRQNYDLFNGGTPAGNVSADNSGTGFGVGGVAGVMFNPNSNTSVGLSAQSPIDLSGNSETKQYLDRIPGRLSGSLAARTDGANGEYLLYGVQANWYFGGQKNKIFPRDNYATVGGGIEYGMRRWNALVPIRIGYTVVPSGGTGFADRDAFTFGVGYRPNGSDASADLSFAKPIDGNSIDIALSLTYILGHK
ncbi:MAG TPA: hypothetical protein VNI20_02555 [Fimbriimonadaceae bacterium]|nr:hypothetical protein [Fimbriimonadaceae bacterium]